MTLHHHAIPSRGSSVRPTPGRDGPVCRCGGGLELDDDQQYQRRDGGDSFTPGALDLLRVPDRLVHVRERPEGAHVDVLVDQHGAHAAGGDHQCEQGGVTARAHQQGNGGKGRQRGLGPEQVALAQNAGLDTVISGGQIDVDVGVQGQARKHDNGQGNPGGEPDSGAHRGITSSQTSRSVHRFLRQHTATGAVRFTHLYPDPATDQVGVGASLPLSRDRSRHGVQMHGSACPVRETWA